MLKIKRKKLSSIRTTIPPHVPADIHKAVEAVIHSENPTKALAAIRPARAFIKAKLNGSTTPEARSLAGISTSAKATEIFKQPVTQLILEDLLSQEDMFSDKGIVSRLKEMWNAKETVVIPTDGGFVKIKKKNWDVRKFAFDRNLELRGYKNKKDDGDKAPQATQIIFNVTPVPGSTAVPIEIKEEPQ